ncbi:N-acetylglucosamine-6-phosphate deacetylase [Daphnia magna]|uniref:N-acetylglucosamine-6-phosphate deacetylase n=1 Tax=Daphnia magna TaxID=35525 RepID=A0A0P4WHL1_9CRUS|nr:N-acetylglucosamine-6-phosphate deacetylase [Daphnia magna]CAG4639188.1 EOG090X06GX [Daphnia magna]
MKSDIIQFHNCFILRDGQIIKEDLWTCERKIVDPEPIFFDKKDYADIKIDCQGLLIAPGYIDLQVNGGFGVDFSRDSETIDQGLEVVAKGLLVYGTTSFCPTLVTSSPEFYHQVVGKIKKTPGSSKGAEILGIHVEGPFINNDKKGAHEKKFIHKFNHGANSIEEVYGKDWRNISMVTLAPELENSTEAIKHLTSNGVTVSLGHSMGSLVQGEEAVRNGASFITHLFNAMLPFHHRDPGLIGLLASSKIPPGKTVYYGIIADGIHTHPAALRIAYRTHPKGLVLVTDAISALGLEPGQYKLGYQDVEVKENCAMLSGTTTLCGAIASMDKCVRHLKRATECSTVEALEAATLHPACALGIQDRKGSLLFGRDADLVMLDHELNVVSTWIASERVYQNPVALELIVQRVTKI